MLNFKKPKNAIPLSMPYTQVAKYPKTIKIRDILDILICIFILLTLKTLIRKIININIWAIYAVNS